MRKILFLLVAILCFAANTPAQGVQFKEGDIVFRSGRNYPVMYISSSRITHCGIIVNTPSGLRVLEANGRVKLTSIENFFGKSISKAKSLTKRIFPEGAKIDYKKYIGKPYDNHFLLNNDSYYCSELVYEIYKEQYGLELFTPKPLYTYNVVGLKWELKRRGIRLTQRVVTPADLFRDYD